MNTTNTRHGADTLLAHTDWLRRFVSQLVRDPHEAEDVVQAVLISANQADPAKLQNPRSWLAGAARRSSAFLARSAGRRRQREAAAAASRTEEIEASTLDLLERAELQKLLIGRVQRLSPKLRDVVLRRYFDDMKPKAIASALGIPVATVRSRLELAMKTLRADLDHEFGDRRAWVAMFVPLLPCGGVAAPVSKVSMLLRPGGLLVASLAVGTGAWMVLRGPAEPPDLRETTPAVQALGGLAAAIDGEPARRVDVPVPEPAAVDRCEGRVVDLQGRPIADATVHVQSAWIFGLMLERGLVDPNVHRVTTDEDGTFSLPWLGSGDSMTIGAPSHADHVTDARTADWRRGEAIELVMRRRTTVPFEVEVVDRATGQPVPRFEVTAASRWFPSHTAFFPDARKDQLRPLRSSEGRDGRFGPMDFDVVDGANITITIAAAGVTDSAQLRRTIETPALGEPIRLQFEIDLDAPERRPDARLMRGEVVLDEAGTPLAGVTIKGLVDRDLRESFRTVMTGTDGRFRLALPEGRESAHCAAEHPDYETKLFTASRQEPCRVTLVRRGSLRVTVRDDATDGPLRRAPILVVGEPNRQQRHTTDDEGSFEVRGELAGRYRIFLLPDPKAPDEHALDSTSFVLRAGIDAEVEFRANAPERVLVSGTVSAPRGSSLRLMPIFVPYRGAGGWVRGRRLGAVGFTAGGLERGSHLVLLVPEDDGDRGASASILPNVEIDGTANQSLHLTQPSAEIRGRLGGSPSQGAGRSVLLLPDVSADADVARDFVQSAKFAQVFARPVAADGSFALRRIAAGRYRLLLREGDATIAERAVDVADAGRIDLGVWAPSER